MVFLSDHCHVVATEKIRNMRTCEEIHNENLNLTSFYLRRPWCRTRPATRHDGSHVPQYFEVQLDCYHPIAQGPPSHHSIKNVENYVRQSPRQIGTSLENSFASTEFFNIYYPTVQTLPRDPIKL